MPRRSKARCLIIRMNGETVGSWTIDARGQHAFAYEHSWTATEGARPISLSMPLQPPSESYRGDLVESFFDNLLPDSIKIRRRMQFRFAARSVSAFDLLYEVGRDCVGALQLLPPDRSSDDVMQIDAESLDEAAVANELRAATTAPPLGQRDEDAFRISLAGAQEKSAFLWQRGQWHRPSGATPTSHIFKLPIGRAGNMQADLSTSVENEWLCRQIVNEFGIPIATCEIADFEDQHVLIVERFDRRLAKNGKWWLRLPQEDMCQATATPPHLKYESDGGPGIVAISELLLASRNSVEDRRIFFKAQVLFWMLCAIDGHAKNFSIHIEPSGRFSLTPLYDVMSAYPILGPGKNQLAPQKARMAMAVQGKNRHYKWREILPRHWLSTAKMVGAEASVADDLCYLAHSAQRVVETISKSLPSGFPEHVSGPIFEGVIGRADTLRAFTD